MAFLSRLHVNSMKIPERLFRGPLLLLAPSMSFGKLIILWNRPKIEINFRFPKSENYFFVNVVTLFLSVTLINTLQ